MSQQLINLNLDLSKLRNEGYCIVVKHDHLILRNVPYVNSNKEIKYGTLVSNLSLANNRTIKPNPHTVFFDGELPCNTDGSPLNKFACSNNPFKLGDEFTANFQFSAKPPNGYDDYYQKMTTYEAMLSGPAQVIDPNVTARTYNVIESDDKNSVFNYIDTASTRAGIYDITRKLELAKIAIIGLGGTGSYVLDLVAKTPAKEIHLFDGDKFLQHNAFRSPGAPSGAELEEQLFKTSYFERIYSKMRRGIVNHTDYISSENVDQLKNMNFVFLCLDKSSIKRLIIDKLQECRIPFVDVGMGVVKTNDSLCGILRTTTSTPNHFTQKVPLSDGDDNNEYDQNIQIADLNALNAALAVVKWKKLFGFYHDLEKEQNCMYTIDGNIITNEDQFE